MIQQSSFTFVFRGVKVKSNGKQARPNLKSDSTIKRLKTRLLNESATRNTKHNPKSNILETKDIIVVKKME